MHVLDNPIWTALNTRQASFSNAGALVRRFSPEVTSLAGLAEESERAIQSLSELLPGYPAGLFLREARTFSAQWTTLRELPLLQMVMDDQGSLPCEHELVALTPDDAPEMLALAQLTQPGPFALRTRELGTYLGVKVNGRIAAMAGERLRVPGYTEISAVCTHPEHTGRGYAASLIAELVRRIRERAETPFLHVAEANQRAITLYHRLGFRQRYRFQLAVVKIGSELAAAV